MVRRFSTTDADFEASFQAFLGTKRESDPDVHEVVTSILDDVKSRGDAALVEYTSRFDRFEVIAADLAFTTAELTAARSNCDTETLAALEMAAKQRFDLVVTDLNMPRMDGITLIQRLRATPAYKFTPILMLTTEAGVDFKMKGKAAGATGWLVKPFDPQKLIATVKKVIG